MNSVTSNFKSCPKPAWNPLTKVKPVGRVLASDIHMTQNINFMTGIIKTQEKQEKNLSNESDKVFKKKWQQELFVTVYPPKSDTANEKFSAEWWALLWTIPTAKTTNLRGGSFQPKCTQSSMEIACATDTWAPNSLEPEKEDIKVIALRSYQSWSFSGGFLGFFCGEKFEGEVFGTCAVEERRTLPTSFVAFNHVLDFLIVFWVWVKS